MRPRAHAPKLPNFQANPANPADPASPASPAATYPPKCRRYSAPSVNLHEPVPMLVPLSW